MFLFQDIVVILMFVFILFLVMLELMDLVSDVVYGKDLYGVGYGDVYGDDYGDGYGSGLSFVEGLNGW